VILYRNILIIKLPCTHVYFFAFVIIYYCTIYIYIYINCGMTANMLRVRGMAKDCCVQREVIAYKMFSRVIIIGFKLYCQNIF